MTIKSKKEKNTMTISVKGRIDTATAPEFEKAVKAAQDITELIIDMDGLEYISSAGLRVLLYAHKSMNGKGTMKLVHVNESIMDILDITGFADVMTIE